MIYYESNELYHHGILGQKWGVRRYQNSNGTLTSEGKARYGSGTRGNARFRPNDKKQRSKNWQINRMGGRKINADYETRRARGEQLVKAGRGDVGAVGRHFARNFLYGAAAGIAATALAGVGQNALETGRYGVGIGAGHAALILKGAAGLYTVSSIVKTYQDISDMHTYKDSKSKKNN